ncbi:MAG TPA: 1-deoxy-D-xylulose-5-phosphate synthase, partial [Cytophagales bacterium]|nr:1-deoxy-D-xylulose-5-phosphate synthase [Cytophagales bacterium]
MIVKPGKMLAKINSPADLRKFEPLELYQICTELRQYIIDTVSVHGGHFAANLGVVELTVAIHYVFNTPEDQLVWDVGHQAYGHKILTGRRDNFFTNRVYKGLSGFPKRSESEYDAFGVGHSSTSISAALGMAVASKIKNEQNRQHIAVIGDGALTGGMAFEAMN